MMASAQALKVAGLEAKVGTLSDRENVVDRLCGRSAFDTEGVRAAMLRGEDFPFTVIATLACAGAVILRTDAVAFALAPFAIGDRQSAGTEARRALHQ